MSDKAKVTRGKKGARHQKSLRLPKALNEKLERHCKRISMDVNTYIVQTLRVALDAVNSHANPQG